MLKRLSANFKVKLFGNLKKFICLNIKIDKDEIKADQRAWPWASKRSPHASSYNTRSHSRKDLQEPSRITRPPIYRPVIRVLLYLAVCTHLGIFFHICALARLLHSPIRRHLAFEKSLLRYIAWTQTFDFRYLRSQKLSSRSIRAHVDANWGSCKDIRKYAIMYVIDFNGMAAEWRSKNQTEIAFYSAEYELLHSLNAQNS